MKTTGESATTSFPLTMILRVVDYQRRHGLVATLGRTTTLVRRSLLANRMVLYYCDLADYARCSEAKNLLEHLAVERMLRQEDIPEPAYRQIVDFWNPRLYQQYFSERFAAGASLWLIRSKGRLAGYGWTMTGHTVVPHYCPLGANDVHFFDFLVFPEFRGRQINPLLVNYMLGQLAAEGRTRAYIEVAEWNQPQLSSLRRTAFRVFGIARKASLLGRTFVEWTTVPGKDLLENASSAATSRDDTNHASLASRQI